MSQSRLNLCWATMGMYGRKEKAPPSSKLSQSCGGSQPARNIFYTSTFLDYFPLSS